MGPFQILGKKWKLKIIIIIMKKSQELTFFAGGKTRLLGGVS